MKKSLIPVVLLLTLIISEDLFSQKLVELKDGSRHLIFIKSSDDEILKVETVSGRDTTFKKSNVTSMEPILVELHLNDSRVLKGNIIEKNNDSIIFVKGHPFYAELGDKYTINTDYPKMIFSLNDVNEINYGDIELAGMTPSERYDLYGKVYPYYGGAIGFPGGINLVGGYVYHSIGFRGSIGGTPGLGIYGFEMEGTFVMMNNEDFQVDLGIGPGFMGGAENLNYVGINIGFVVYGFYGKLSLLGYESRYEVPYSAFIFQLGYLFRGNKPVNN